MAENSILIAMIYMLLFVLVLMSVIVGALSIALTIFISKDNNKKEKTHL